MNIKSPKELIEYVNEVLKEDKDKIVCYEYTKPKNHLGVDEYIKHVTSKLYE